MLHDNGTLICLLPEGIIDCPVWKDRDVCVSFDEDGLSLLLAGENDEALTETVAYIMDLEEDFPEERCFEVFVSGDEPLDFRSTGSQCFIRLFEIAPSRRVILSNVLLSVEQSITLATRDHPVALEFVSGMFEDGGTAFLDALQNRQEPFGSLMFSLKKPINEVNMQRLPQLESIDHFQTYHLKDDKLLPLSSRAKSVTFEWVFEDLESEFGSLNILTRELAFEFDVQQRIFPTERVIALCRRLAHVGHLKALKIAFLSFNHSVDMPDAVGREVFHTVLANLDLQVLDLTTGPFHTHWTIRQIKELFDCLKKHRALQTLKITS
jgi:hypothetical protein